MERDARGGDGPAGHGGRGDGRLVGAAVDHGALINQPAYAQRLAQEFSYVTPENTTKWGALQPSARDSWSLTQADAIVGAAIANMQQVKVHTFIWHTSSCLRSSPVESARTTCSRCWSSTSGR